MRQGYAEVLVRVVADRIALGGLGLEIETGLQLVEPAGLTGREDDVREQPA
jgi:hypothetical protein